ncbi:hypothetical protein GCK72_025141 [Caenorhabditis remanei]|uniref:Uncharacterized protein n=1 Tax=Caenorhabditis remanei TaxID=31234 RepID=A0A6A5G228_CAERE|nr:hypothetical protein GCK72_025141 [Caenorhabditis remanei]KAF1748674.1 hypothetical protein GCK72_025141 [Caenorhabditis remanei]
MPIDRSYKDVEKEIIKRLAGTPGLASLYDAVRKDENNPSLLHAVAEFVMHDYQSASGTNIAQPYKGILTISDIRCMHQDFEEGLNMSQQMAERLLLFRLVEVYERQIETYKSETLCFKLNTCAITETNDPRFAKVEKEFEENFDFEETEDIFTKKYLLFPNFLDLFGYFTLLINPGAALKQKNGKDSQDKCIMVHIGNEDQMYRYLDRVIPRIEKLLELFLGLHADEKGYLGMDKSQIKQEIRYIDTLHRTDRPFQLIHLLEKMLITEKPLKDFDAILEQIKNNPRALLQIDGIRIEMLTTVEMAIREGEDKSRKHLLETVRRAGEISRQKRIQREREEAIAAERRQLKRFRPDEVITIDD